MKIPEGYRKLGIGEIIPEGSLIASRDIKWDDNPNSVGHPYKNRSLLVIVPTTPIKPTIALSSLPKGSTIYVAGPMRGYHCLNFERFYYWAAKLRGMGFEVINPAEMDTVRMLDGWQWKESEYDKVLNIDLERIQAEADAVFLLNGWVFSPGANKEVEKALELGLGIFYEDEQ